MYTLDYTDRQLDRLHDLINHDRPIRIIHILWDDTRHIQDRYIVLVDCDPATYTLLLML